MQPSLVYTIGHSTRPIEEFIGLLQAHEVARVIDVRTIPRSRYNPQYNRDELARSLAQHGIGYTHFPGLGGLRRRQQQSPNSGWHNASFQGYADYMQTDEFAKNLEQVMEIARLELLALMCAEAVPWRCHRSLIADALLVRGVRVEEINNMRRTQPLELTTFARVTGNRITYPPQPPQTGSLF